LSIPSDVLFPYNKRRASEETGAHLGGHRILSPVLPLGVHSPLSPSNANYFTPREVPALGQFNFPSPLQASIETSNEVAYSHWGVGESGPIGRYLADQTGSYEAASRVDPEGTRDSGAEMLREMSLPINVQLAAKLGGFAFGAGYFGLAFRRGYAEADQDELLRRVFAGTMSGAASYPKMAMWYGIGGAIFGAGAALLSGQRADISNYLALALRELISYPISKFLGKRLLGTQVGLNVMNWAGHVGAEVFERVGGPWATAKAREFRAASDIARTTLENWENVALRNANIETLRRHPGYSTVLQEIVDVPVDLTAYAILRRLFGGFDESKESSRDESSRHAYSHYGPGETGPVARLFTGGLGTYHQHSTVDTLKAATLGALNVAKSFYNPVETSIHITPWGEAIIKNPPPVLGLVPRYLSKLVKEQSIPKVKKDVLLAELKLSKFNLIRRTNSIFSPVSARSVFEKTFKKYNITEKEFSRWAGQNRLTDKLRVRGVHPTDLKRDISLYLVKSPEKVEDRAFQSSRSKFIESSKIKRYHSIPSADSLAQKVAFLGIGERVPKVAGLPKSDIVKAKPQLEEVRNTKPGRDIIIPTPSSTPTPSYQSNVNIRVRKIIPSAVEIDRTLAQRLRRSSINA